MPLTKTVMIVEDDAELLESMREALELHGFHVVTAGNGQEALCWLEANTPPDLILLDLMMPVMDGWQFIQEQRARPAIARVPVALLSGERDIARHATALAVAAWVEKPVALSELLFTVRRLAGAVGGA